MVSFIIFYVFDYAWACVCVGVQYPVDYVNQVAYDNMTMRVSPGRTYKFYTGKPVFEFGTGLSYTTFSMQWYV